MNLWPSGSSVPPGESPNEPDGLLSAETTAEDVQFPPTPTHPWPMMVQGRGAELEPLPSGPAPEVPPPPGGLASTILGYDQRWRPIVDLFRTIWYELRGGRGAEPEGAVSGGSLIAVGILGALVTAIVVVATLATSGSGGVLVAALAGTIMLTICYLGWARNRRPPRSSQLSD